MTPATQPRRPPSGLFPDKAAPRVHDRIVEGLLGHKYVRTTIIYTRVLNRGGRSMHSPADRLARQAL